MLLTLLGNFLALNWGVLFDNGSASSNFSSDAVEMFKRMPVLNQHENWQVYLSKDLYEKFMFLGQLINHPYFPDQIQEKCLLFNQHFQIVDPSEMDEKSFMFFSGDLCYERDVNIYNQGHNSTPFDVKTLLSELKNILMAVESYYKLNLPKHTPTCTIKI